MPAHEQLANQFKITVNGASIDGDVDAALTSATVETSTNLPDMFVLTFRDPSRDVLSRGRFKVGASVVIKVFSREHTGGVKLFDGEVTAVEMELESHGTFTIVRGFDRSHRLHRVRETRAHKDMRYSQIARELAMEAGLEIGEIDRTKPRHQLVPQVNATAWTFLKQLAAEVGCEVAVVDGKFNFRRPARASEAPAMGTAGSVNPLQLSVGVNLLRCRATVTAADQVKRVEVRGWDPIAKKEVVGTSPATTTSAENGSGPAELAAKFSSGKRVSVDVPYSTKEEVDEAADALAQTVASSFAEVEGTSRGDPGLRAGAKISISLAKAPFDGKYVLTSARHSWVPDEGYLVTFVASGARDRSLHGLIAGSGAGSSEQRGVSRGVAIAIVADLRDPRKEGRVKLAFPWLDPSYESDWVRTCQQGAGKGRGWVVLPEVGDEVLVAFQHGDFRLPIVLGGLYNGKDKPGDAAMKELLDSGQVNRRTFVSRTGHHLAFIDHSGSSAVEVNSQGEVRIVGKKQFTITSSDAGLEVTTKGDIVLEANNGDVKITGKNVTIEGKSKVDVKAATGMKLDGGADMTVKGAMVKIN